MAPCFGRRRRLTAVTVLNMELIFSGRWWMTVLGGAICDDGWKWSQEEEDDCKFREFFLILFNMYMFFYDQLSRRDKVRSTSFMLSLG